MKFIALIFPLALTACAQPMAQKTPRMTAPHTLTAAERALVEAGVRASLKDPDAAKFGAMSATKDDHSGQIAVCGYVNGKNGFGGYTGERLYFGLMTTKTATGEPAFMPYMLGETGVTASVARDSCAERGIHDI